MLCANSPRPPPHLPMTQTLSGSCRNGAPYEQLNTRPQTLPFPLSAAPTPLLTPARWCASSYFRFSLRVTLSVLPSPVGDVRSLHPAAYIQGQALHPARTAGSTCRHLAPVTHPKPGGCTAPCASPLAPVPCRTGPLLCRRWGAMWPSRLSLPATLPQLLLYDPAPCCAMGPLRQPPTSGPQRQLRLVCTQ